MNKLQTPVHFNSVFADDLVNFIALKRSLGIKFQNAEYFAKQFDELVKGKQLQQKALTKSMVVEFCTPQAHQSPNTVKPKISFIRQFSIYLRSRKICEAWPLPRIYGGRYKKGGIKLRIHSLVLIASAAVSLAVAFGVLALGERLLGMVLNRAVSVFIVCMAAAGAATLGACVLNAFVCPYGVKLGDVLTGSLLTVVLWLVCGAGFAVYLRYADPVRLYGRIASVIVFLLWCYLMMNCFVIGVIYNGRHCVTPKHTLA